MRRLNLKISLMEATVNAKVALAELKLRKDIAEQIKKHSETIFYDEVNCPPYEMIGTNDAMSIALGIFQDYETCQKNQEN